MTTVNTASTPLTQTGKADRGFLAVLAEASTYGGFENGAEGSGPEAATEESSAAAGKSAPQGTQSPVLKVTRDNREPSTNATVNATAADQGKTSLKGNPIAPEETSASSRDASEVLAAIQPSFITGIRVLEQGQKWFGQRRRALFISHPARDPRSPQGSAHGMVLVPEMQPTIPLTHRQAAHDIAEEFGDVLARRASPR